MIVIERSIVNKNTSSVEEQKNRSSGAVWQSEADLTKLSHITEKCCQQAKTDVMGFPENLLIFCLLNFVLCPTNTDWHLYQ